MLAGFIVGFVFLILLIATLAFLGFAFWIWMIIDCAKRSFKKDIDKVVWILVIVFLNVLGAAIYYFVVKAGDNKVIKDKKGK